MINKVIYHDNCPDGFASAYISWKYLGGNAKYIPMKYGVWEEDAVEDGDSVLLLDISFQPEQLMEWYDRAESIVLLDHHESIASELTKMPFETVIDFDECGASLAHHYFAPDKPTPTLVSYIRDRDLWRWELPYSREVSAYIASYPFDVEIWGQIEWTMDTTFSLVVSEGAAILRGHNEMVERLVEGAYVNRFLGFEVPMVNSAILQSEIGNRLLELHGEASFAVVYNVLRNGMKKYSLRGRIGGIDLGQLAKEHGGGRTPASGGAYAIMSAYDDYEITMTVKHGETEKTYNLTLSPEDFGPILYIQAEVFDSHESPECRMHVDLTAMSWITSD